MDGGALSLDEAPARGLERVELGQREHRAAVRVLPQHSPGIGGQVEPVLLGPFGHVGPASANHGDVQGVDANLLEDDHATVRRSKRASERRLDRIDLALQPLQRPVPAFLDLHGDSGQRDDVAEPLGIAREPEPRYVVFVAGVPRGERGGLPEDLGMAGRDQSSAGKGGPGAEHEQSHHQDNDREQPPRHRVPLSWVPGIVPH